MTKSIIFLTILMFSLSILFAQQEPIKAITVGNNIELYSSPDIKSKIISRYEKDVEVYILRSYQDWYKIKANEKTGWTQKVNIIIPISKDLKIYNGTPPQLIDKKDKTNNKKIAKPIKHFEQNHARDIEQSIHYIDFTKKMRETQWGIVFGVNFTQYSSSEKSIFESNLSHYFAGINLLYNANPYITFNSGLFYSIKGIEFDYNADIIDFNIRYLEIPLSLKYSFSGIQNSSFFMRFGPYLDFYLNNSLDNTNEFLSKNLTTMDMGLQYCFGYQLALNPNSKLFIEASYLVGTNSVFQEKIHEKIYNYNFNLNIGLIF